MTCQPSPEKPLSAQLRAKRQDELYADMQVRMDISSLKRSLEKRERIRKDIQVILEKMEEKAKNRKNPRKNEEETDGQRSE